MIIFQAALFALLALGGAIVPALAQDQPVRASIIQLISTPEKYEGKIVAVAGYIHLEFEGNGIYLHKDDYEYSLNNNGLWIDLYECGSPRDDKFTDGYAYVVGRFTATDRGHLGSWSGSLQEIKSCQSWPPIAPPSPGT